MGSYLFCFKLIGKFMFKCQCNFNIKEFYLVVVTLCSCFVAVKMVPNNVKMNNEFLYVTCH